ncbi:MAG: hypothetical protein HQL56_02880 [Magnetococcales bacterium]|nr:hypothetical protein [Magnetococcales bacterium]
MVRISMLIVLFPTLVWSESGLAIPVVPLQQAPVIDGDWNDWKSARLSPKVVPLETSSLGQDAEAENATEEKSWQPILQVQAGLFGTRFYLAAQWTDSVANTQYKPLKKMGSGYRRGLNKDDMFAIRFPISGDFAKCMISRRTYATDLWIWSAGRSNLVGRAEDLTHRFSPQRLDPAQEYASPYGTIYIQKLPDEGQRGWAYTPDPKEPGPEIIPGVIVQGEPSGSRADVQAKGSWKDGFWTLEISRELKTPDPNDVVFPTRGEVIGQIALFNAEYTLRKRISEPLHFVFPGVP